MSMQDTADANYILTVVSNGHNYVATATTGNAQGRSQNFTLVATEAERRSIFFSKKLTRPNKVSIFS